ncbi:ABC transporter substrate-binding protein [Paenibacillus mesophilus]|uniref:ABC transporter substrate-binding protein n=1 Tax=Paenibacillus mesophilus TaxID=2582849 RepID=UPI00130523CC|nr:extracellular solute-binding protein [Paenibacillus mesophilus]
MKRKGAPGVLAAALLVTMLAACGTTREAESGNRDGAGSSAPKPGGSKEQVELTVYNTTLLWEPEEFENMFLRPVEKKYPHIKLKFVPYRQSKTNAISDMIASGETPDLIMSSVGSVETWIKSLQLQYDLTPLAQQHKYDLNRLDPTILDLMRIISDGKLYGLPIYESPAPLFYNKDLFDKFGVAYPQNNLTWDDVYELSRKLTRNEGGVQYLGFYGDTTPLVRRNQLSLTGLDASGQKSALQTDAWKRYFETLVRIYQLPGYERNNAGAIQSQAVHNAFLKDRKVAMLMSGAQILSEKTAGGLNWDMVAYPGDAQKPGVGAQPYPFALFIAANSKHKEEAFEALMHLTSVEYQMEQSRKGIFPTVLKDESVRKAFGAENPFYKGKNVSAMLPAKYAEVPAANYSKYGSFALNNARVALEKALAGTGDLNSLLREADEAADKQIAAEKNK